LGDRPPDLLHAFLVLHQRHLLDRLNVLHLWHLDDTFLHDLYWNLLLDLPTLDDLDGHLALVVLVLRPHLDDRLRLDNWPWDLSDDLMDHRPLHLLDLLHDLRLDHMRHHRLNSSRHNSLDHLRHHSLHPFFHHGLHNFGNHRLNDLGHCGCERRHGGRTVPNEAKVSKVCTLDIYDPLEQLSIRHRHRSPNDLVPKRAVE